jgi:hypothetical protein
MLLFLLNRGCVGVDVVIGAKAIAPSIELFARSTKLFFILLQEQHGKGCS